MLRMGMMVLAALAVVLLVDAMVLGGQLQRQITSDAGKCFSSVNQQARSLPTNGSPTAINSIGKATNSAFSNVESSLNGRSK